MPDIGMFRNVPSVSGPDGTRLRRQDIQSALGFDLIDGYHLQFGVHIGLTLKYMANLKPYVHWYGFDSFEGLPSQWRMGEKTYEKGKFKLDRPPQMPGNVTLVQGWFRDTAGPFCDRMKVPAAFVDIDSDLYESARDVLFNLNKRIVPGTVIRFDELCEWREFDGWVTQGPPRSHYTRWREHEWKALCEWCEEKGRKVEALCRSDHEAGTVRVVE